MTKIRNNIKYLIMFVLFVILLLNIIFLFVSRWLEENVGLVSFDEIIFHLNVPVDGTDSNMVNDIILKCIVPSICIFISIVILLCKNYKISICFNVRLFSKRIQIGLRSIFRVLILVVANIVLLCINYTELNQKFGISDYIKLQLNSSSFIEENYVDARKINLTFPSEKRNLIYIFLESMESTYIDVDNGGFQEINIIPELTKLAYDNINFSNNDKIGGASPMSGTGWTIGAMVAHSAGIPLKLPSGLQNDFIGYDSFLPGVYNLGDILHDNGYTNVIMFGSDASFGGRKDYYSLHGNYIIKDYYTAKEDGIIEKNYKAFWGMEDSYLFEYAKKELLDLSKDDKPFNLNLLTVNTHFPNGYLEDENYKMFGDNDYANSICFSSKQVNEFVDWIREQDFYDNTTIVIVGDHLTMAKNEILDGIERSDRKIYNVIINSKVTPHNTKNRCFTSLDMFPTTLASIGVKIEGDRLGLGTNLFSDKQTLPEQYGRDFVSNELNAKSNFYDNNLLFGNN